MGVAMMGNNFGGVVLPGIVGAVIAYGGWQTGYYLQGLLTSFIAITVLVALREPRIERTIRQTPNLVHEASRKSPS